LISSCLLFIATSTVASEQLGCQWQAPQTPIDVEFQQPPFKSPTFLTGKTIGDITLIRHNVFSDDKTLSLNWLYQWLNDIHTVTREKVILQELSFDPNGLFDPVKIRESERLLRHQKYIYDARIKPVKLCGETVSLAISTRDTWSITPAFNLSHNGDETKTRLSLTESNFMGSGKLVSIARSSNAQRQEYTLIYRDPNMSGSHIKNAIEYSDNSDGHRHYVALELPFYALNSKTSYGMYYTNEKLNDPIYQQQDKLTDLTHQINSYQLFGGYSQGYVDNQSIRWRYGINFEKDIFGKTDHSLSLIPLNSRTNFYPWLEFSLLENRYKTLTNFHSIKRTEDINLGRNFSASLGYSPRSWSNDKSRLIYHVQSKNAFQFRNDLITVAGSISGNWLADDKKSRDVTAKLNAQYYHFSNKDWVFYANASFNLLKSPYIENQLFLGGDTGLRGYPVRYKMGNKNALINIEQRYYSDLYWWKLIRVGGAVFIDVARNWGAQSPLISDYASIDNRWLSNIGMGLRLAPSRADANHVIHIDLAFPLTQAPDIDRARFIIQVKQSF